MLLALDYGFVAARHSRQEAALASSVNYRVIICVAPEAGTRDNCQKVDKNCLISGNRRMTGSAEASLGNRGAGAETKLFF